MNADLLKKLIQEAESLRKELPPPATEPDKLKKFDLKDLAKEKHAAAVSAMDSPEDLSGYFTALTDRLFWHFVTNCGFTYFSAKSTRVRSWFAKHFESACNPALIGDYTRILASPNYVVERVTELVKPFGFIAKKSEFCTYWTNRSSAKSQREITPV
jgi:hypothetical protein